MILVDTSVLGRLANAASAAHLTAKDAVRNLAHAGNMPVVVPQCHYEFWTIATRPAAINGLGMTPAEADNWLTHLGRTARLLPDDPRIYDIWRQLVRSHQTKGKAAHDARLVAAMQVHGVPAILTFNSSDFTRYGISVIEPAHVQ